MEEEIAQETPETVETAGTHLKAAREAKGLALAQVAGETRIQERHLAAIEAGEYARLPSRTYAIGFARTYARFLGLDENETVERVRADLNEGQVRASAPAGFEPGDPARVPSRALAWFAVLAAVMLGAGVFVFYRSYFAPGLGPAPLSEPKPAVSANPKPAATAAAPSATGQVVFTSLMDDTWVSFYDAKGEKLYEGIMTKGQTFAVPPTADNPQIRTGRPYAFAITVGGKPVPKLSEEDIVVKDMPVSAAALVARPPVAAATGTATPPAPTNGATRPGVAPTPR